MTLPWSVIVAPAGYIPETWSCPYARRSLFASSSILDFHGFKGITLISNQNTALSVCACVCMFVCV